MGLQRRHLSNSRFRVTNMGVFLVDNRCSCSSASLFQSDQPGSFSRNFYQDINHVDGYLFPYFVNCYCGGITFCIKCVISIWTSSFVHSNTSPQKNLKGGCVVILCGCCSNPVFNIALLLFQSLSRRTQTPDSCHAKSKTTTATAFELFNSSGRDKDDKTSLGDYHGPLRSMDSYVHNCGASLLWHFAVSMGTFDFRLLDVYDGCHESTDIRVHGQVFSCGVRSDSEVQ